MKAWDQVRLQREKALLVLADGTTFFGESLGASGIAVGEVVFNTSMTGYQEMLTDPSYAEQMLTLTYPHIGNVGVNNDDVESNDVHANGLIIREESPIVSNWRSSLSLRQYLQDHHVVGICGVDTRRLTRHLRDHGAQSGCIMAGDIDDAKALEIAQAFPGLNGVDLAKTVTCEKTFAWTEASLDMIKTGTATTQQHVVVYDFGVKKQILRMLVDRGCTVTVVPATTPAQQVIDLQPDGVMLSNGPGDPAACDYAIAATQQLLDQGLPIFGICLGHQIFALAMGAKTIKMKFGHHGANHPVKDLQRGTVAITSQNHGFAVDDASLPDDVVLTHVSLFDASVQGLMHKTLPAFSFQGHPEASPGPQDIGYLFDQFVTNMQQHKVGA